MFWFYHLYCTVRTQYSHQRFPAAAGSCFHQTALSPVLVTNGGFVFSFTLANMSAFEYMLDIRIITGKCRLYCSSHFDSFCFWSWNTDVFGIHCNCCKSKQTAEAVLHEEARYKQEKNTGGEFLTFKNGTVL